MSSTCRVPRSATLSLVGQQPQTRPLADWEDEAAYVLLAESGAGKTDAFLSLGHRIGCAYVSARDFATLRDHDAWRGKTLFIDGLDEVRAEATEGLDVLLAIRSRLDEIGRPKFRLACREADWFGATDRQTLQSISPNGKLVALTLDPLSDEDILSLLRATDRAASKAQQFLDEADARGLHELLRNPLMLRMLVAAQNDGQRWPESRADLFALACQTLLSRDVEENPWHRRARLKRAKSFPNDLDQIAGEACAVLLLSGREQFAVEIDVDGNNAVALNTLVWHRPLEHMLAALNSGIFRAANGHRQPAHRSVGEYLAARALAARVQNGGLPLARVLALMTAEDGGMVEPLRGLNAWLSVHCVGESRQRLITVDPLGVVLYGDVRVFTLAERIAVLQGLAKVAQSDPTFRRDIWRGEPFSALGGRDLVPTFLQGLRLDSDDPAHLALLSCALDAIRHGEAMPELVPALEDWVRRGRAPGYLRASAMRAMLQQSKDDAAPAIRLLSQIDAGAVPDAEDELCGTLLTTLYPTHLTPLQALQYLHEPKATHLIGRYLMFWRRDFGTRTPSAVIPELLDQLSNAAGVELQPREGLFHHTAGQLLLRGLCEHGANQPVERTYRWLGIGFGLHDHSHLDAETAQAIRNWLSANPIEHQRLLEHGYANVVPAQDGHLRYWRVNQRLQNAPLPEDRIAWMMSLADRAAHESMARHCLDLAARWAIAEPELAVRWMVPIEQWVATNSLRWPKAALWLEEAWSSRLDDWQVDRHRQDKSASEASQVRRAERRKKLRPQLQALREGKAAAGLMHQLALAYDDRFTDIEGETPLDRVVSYLGGDKVESQCAIASFKATLHRADLPSVEEILSLDRQGRYHLIRPACLIGADLAFAESSQAPASWDDSLAGRLAAFALTKISNDMPRWFHIITASRPALVAEIFVEYAAPKLQAKKQQHISLLWQLGDDAELADIARRVLPPLLKSFPARALPHQLELLNKALLPALGTRLSSEERRPLLASRLARRSLDAGQRIALSLAALNSGEQGQIDELVAFVGNSQSRAAHLANAARYQSAGGGHSGADATSLGKLIALLAPHVAPEPQHALGWVSDFDEQRELLRTLVLRLAAMATAEAAKQLLTLRHQVAIRAWRPMLDFALVEHTRIARAASFTHANPQQIIEVIQGGAPANAHDLAALTVEVLRDIAADLRGGESSGLKLFWSHYGRETALPLDEPDCRDLLLDRLKQKLSPLSIAVEREPSAAFDKRADLRVSCWIGGKHVRVPIEVKKDKHRDVWVAWRDQLSQYTSDPACAGVGIYLVLWFGVGSRAAPEGFRPTSSGEMADALKSRTSIEQSARVHMLVMDLSWPNLARR